MHAYEMQWLSPNATIQGSGLTTVWAESGDRVVNSAVTELLTALGPQARRIADQSAHIRLCLDGELSKESFTLSAAEGVVTIRGGDGPGVLYGVHHLLRRLAQGHPLQGLSAAVTPDNPLRMLNHWDNADGSIERGYAGRSFFLKDGEIIVDSRTRDYARLVASVGINAVVINNVNVKGAATYFIREPHLTRLAQLQAIFADYGIRLLLSLNFAAPMEMGELNSADPLDPQVIAWWEQACATVFQRLPGFGGFLVKADSEGRPGPFTYNRTHAQGANMLARAVEPYDGLIVWRCFVYNCQQDWRDLKTDRARAAYDNFMPLDGSFLPNVILQIKNGPMDFQIREPVSPLFGGLTKTNQMLEVQIAQEYTGQQKHLCYLIPMFQEVLSFQTRCSQQNDRVADIVSGRAFGQKNCGIVAVANTGDAENWTGHDLAAANLFGFGRLAFQTSLSAQEIAREWIALSYSLPREKSDLLCGMLMQSRDVYENYTSPLGIGWMVNPSHHFGPNVDGYEYDRWGTYHRADHKGMGVDRSSKGTGYATLYHKSNAALYERPESCPEELLLFFHHLPYDYRLASGKTLLQHIYDTHFLGAQQVEQMAADWETLADHLPPQVFARVRERLAFQVAHSKEWRDVVNSYFYRKSAIGDAQGRPIY